MSGERRRAKWMDVPLALEPDPHVLRLGMAARIGDRLLAPPIQCGLDLTR